MPRNARRGRQPTEDEGEKISATRTMLERILKLHEETVAQNEADRMEAREENRKVKEILDEQARKQD